MKSLAIEDVGVLRELFEVLITEKKASHRITPDRALDKVDAALKTGLVTVLVDDVHLPRMLLIMQVGHSMVFDEMTCTVFLVYIPKEYRTLERGEMLHAEIVKHARVKGAKIINGSSWFEGGERIDNFWKRAGYSEQETVYVKYL